MAHHLEDVDTNISWTEGRRICVGYRDCAVCGLETPRPSMADMVEFAQADCGRFMWPGEYWKPAGWGNDHDRGLICPECVEAKEAAFRSRMKSK